MGGWNKGISGVGDGGGREVEAESDRSLKGFVGLEVGVELEFAEGVGEEGILGMRGMRSPASEALRARAFAENSAFLSLSWRIWVST